MSHILFIRKKSQNEMLVLLVLFVSVALAFLIQFLKLPELVKYTVDVLWLMLLITIGINRFRMPNKEMRTLLKVILAFWLITLFGFILNISNGVYYLWGFRNNFRFFVFFLACAMFLKTQTAHNILDIFDKLFYLHFVICLFQFLVLEKEGDYLGGIFGTQSGCNGSQIIFLAIITARSILRYMDGEVTFWDCLTKCGLSIIIAAIAELKFFFILLVTIIAIASLVTKFSVKKLGIILLVGFGVFVGIALLIRIYPSWEGFFSLESIFATVLSEKGYTGSGDINRLTAIPMVWTRFLNTWYQKLFGLGLGNCDTSAFAFLQTPFYQKYGYLHYNFFSTAFMFLETGIIGFAMYLSFFLVIFFMARRRLKSGNTSKEMAHLSEVIALISMTIIVYNSSMRIEVAYMIYFVLALPFINAQQKTHVPKEVSTFA